MWNRELTTTTLPWWKSAAYSVGLPSIVASASPLKTAPGTVTSVVAEVTIGLVKGHAEIVPASD